MPFGLLSYHTSNLGDFIQSLAAYRFLPTVDRYIDREALDDAGPIEGEPVKLIMNGWFCHRPDRWPPSPFINPLLISVHITNNPEPGSEMRARELFARSPQVLRYLHEHGPVGARDHDTLAWLRSFGIDTYYSGCLTLTLDRPAVPKEPFIVLNEVPTAVAMKVQSATDMPVRHTTHEDHVTVGAEARLERAAALIELYARASCVVTSRMHGALPCLAMGTPALLIETAWDPIASPVCATLCTTARSRIFCLAAWTTMSAIRLPIPSCTCRYETNWKDGPWPLREACPLTSTAGC